MMQRSISLNSAEARPEYRGMRIDPIIPAAWILALLAWIGLLDFLYGDIYRPEALLPLLISAAAAGLMRWMARGLRGIL